MKRYNDEFHNPYDLSQSTGNIGVGKFRRTVKKKRPSEYISDGSAKNPYDAREIRRITREK